MQRLLLIAACAVLAACASAPEVKSHSLRVNGTGRTFEEAKQNAFKNAIEFHAGSIVVSERESRNLKLFKDEILSYSSGYIDSYSVVSQFRTSAGTEEVVLNVTVASNKIAQRILGETKSITNFEGERHALQYETYVKNKEEGEKFLKNILNDFPYRAITVKQTPYTLELDGDRNPFINVGYKIFWNTNYLGSLRTALTAIQDGGGRNSGDFAGSVFISYKYPGDWLATPTFHNFHDTVTRDLVISNIWHQLRIQVRLRDKSHNDLWRKCYIPLFMHGEGHSLYYSNGSRFELYGVPEAVRGIEEATITIKMGRNPKEILQQLSEIDMRPIRPEDCDVGNQY